MIPVEELILQLGITLLVSMLLGAVFSKFKQPAVVGYLMGGILLGPYMLGFIQQTDSLVLNLFSELGVLMLLFFIGLEMDIKAFREGGLAALILAPAKMFTCFVLGYILGTFLGFDASGSVILGLIIAFSSTATIGKYVFDKKRTGTADGKIIMPTLVVQDFIAVTVVALLSSYGSQGSMNTIVLNSIFFVVFGLFVTGRLSGYLIRLMKRFDYEKHITLYALGIAFALASLAAYLGLSPAVGAFIAGFMLSGRLVDKISKELELFRNFFVAFFFIGVGLNFVPVGFDVVLMTAAVLVVYLIGHTFAYGFFGSLIGMRPHFTMRLAGSMVPLGEFSLIIASTALAMNIPHASTLLSVSIFMCIATMVIMPYFIKHSDGISQKIGIVAPDFLERKFEKLVRKTQDLINEPLQKKSVQNRLFFHFKVIAFNIFVVTAIAYLMVYIELESVTKIFYGIPNYVILFIMGALLSLRFLQSTVIELRRIMLIVFEHSSHTVFSKYSKEDRDAIEDAISNIFVSFFILTASVVLFMLSVYLTKLFEVPAIVTAALGALVVVINYLKLRNIRSRNHSTRNKNGILRAR